jgi:hypothetical protein
MSRQGASFLELAIAGEVLLDEVDDFIDMWHDTPGGQELRDFLGMSREEYELYLNSADWLSWIVAARKSGMPIKSYMEEANRNTAMAARGMDATTAAKLVAWLEQHA